LKKENKAFFSEKNWRRGYKISPFFLGRGRLRGGWEK